MIVGFLNNICETSISEIDIDNTLSMFLFWQLLLSHIIELLAKFVKAIT